MANATMHQCTASDAELQGIEVVCSQPSASSSTVERASALSYNTAISECTSPVAVDALATCSTRIVRLANGTLGPATMPLAPAATAASLRLAALRQRILSRSAPSS